MCTNMVLHTSYELFKKLQSCKVVLLEIGGNLSIVAPAVHNDFVTRRMEPGIREEFGQFINNGVNYFLGLITSNIELSRRWLHSEASVRYFICAGANFRNALKAMQNISKTLSEYNHCSYSYHKPKQYCVQGLLPRA